MNPFTTLGLAETATPAEVKKAYRARLLQSHPDVIGEAGHQLTIDLIAAYEQAMVLAEANAAVVALDLREGFVPAQFTVQGARTQSGFVTSTFAAA